MQTLDDANLEHLRIKITGVERNELIDQVRQLVLSAYSDRWNKFYYLQRTSFIWVRTITQMFMSVLVRLVLWLIGLL